METSGGILNGFWGVEARDRCILVVCVCAAAYLCGVYDGVVDDLAEKASKWITSEERLSNDGGNERSGES